MKKSIFVDVGTFSVPGGLYRTYWGPATGFSEFVAVGRSKLEKSIFSILSCIPTFKAIFERFEGSSMVPSEKAIGLKIDMRPSYLGCMPQKKFQPGAQ